MKFCHLFCFFLLYGGIIKAGIALAFEGGEDAQSPELADDSVAYSHGSRASEVTSLQADAVADGHITAARLKGSLRTVQPLISDGEPLLNEAKSLFAFARNLHGKQRLFPITRQHFWRLVQRYAEVAGIPERKRHPHILKHTIAMQVIHSARELRTRASISATNRWHPPAHI